MVSYVALFDLTVTVHEACIVIAILHSQMVVAPPGGGAMNSRISGLLVR
jgi:hypothetical protein